MTSSARAQITLPAPPRLSGYVQAREVAQEHVGLTVFLNRARFAVDGALPQHFSYRLLTELEASAGARVPATVSLREAIIRWVPNSFSFTAGQFKTPFSREYLIIVPLLETADFAAVVDSLAPKYDVGLMAEYTYGPLLTVDLGVFNGEGQNAIANRDSTVLTVGRLVARPIAQFSVGGSIARDGPDSLRWGAEAVIEERGGMVRAEYITRHRRGRSTDKDDYGWYVLATYVVIPRFTLLARVEDFRRPFYGPSRQVRAATAGINLDIVPNRIRLLLEDVSRRTGAKLARTDTFLAQVQVRF
jgi:hypothetical protein